MNTYTATVIVKVAIAGPVVAAAALFSSIHAAPSEAAPDVCRSHGWTWGVGDDNCDGVIMEDESGWDCRTMGNHVCGPGNVQGVPPGDYSAWDE